MLYNKKLNKNMIKASQVYTSIYISMISFLYKKESLSWTLTLKKIKIKIRASRVVIIKDNVLDYMLMNILSWYYLFLELLIII